MADESGQLLRRHGWGEKLSEKGLSSSQTFCYEAGHLDVEVGWMVITYDERFAYTSHPDSQAISGFRIGEDGAISLLSAKRLTIPTTSDIFPLEEFLSSNSHFLYFLDSRLLLKPQPGLEMLSEFLIHHDGSLTFVVNSAQISLPFNATGLATE